MLSKFQHNMKAIQWGKDSLSTNGGEKTTLHMTVDVHKAIKIKMPFYFIPDTKINSKWNKELSLRAKILKVKHRGNHHDIIFGSDFLDRASKA